MPLEGTRQKGRPALAGLLLSVRGECFSAGHVRPGYNLLRVYRSKLADTVLAGASIETIRRRLLKVGARVRETPQRLWVHIAGGFPYREVLGLVM